MPNTFTQIGVAQVVTSASQASIDFVSIPNTFTDLVVRYSLRTTLIGGPFYFDDMGVRFNGDTTSTIYSRSLIRARQGSMGVFSTTDATFFPFFESNAGNATANSFGNGEMWISNYATSSFKGLTINGGSETQHNSEVVTGIISGCYKSTSPITSIKIYSQNGMNIVQNSTAYLYGVSKS